jgi:hypothetical protein
MSEYCDYCQASVEPWDEGDGKYSCPSCLNILIDDNKTLTAAEAAGYNTYTADAGKDMWGRDKSSTWNTGYTPWWKKAASWAGGVWSGYDSQTSLSSGWSSPATTRYTGWSVDRTKSYRMMKHKNHLDGLAKIVDPTIKHELDYATAKQSYCDMENAIIRVDGSIILENDDKLDVVAGLAIHEKLHLVHSEPLMIHLKTQRAHIKREHGDWGFDLYKSVCNLIEDEYIEKQLPKTCPGYVSYISAVKDHYWKKKSEDMQECDEPFGDLMQTIMLFVRYPSSLQAPQKRRWNNDLRIVENILKKDGLDKEGRLTAMDKLWKHLVQRAKQLGYEEDTDFKTMYGQMIGDATDEYEKDFRKKYGGDMSEEDIKEYIDRFRGEIEDEKRSEYQHARSPMHRAMEAVGEKVRKIIRELTGEAEKGTISEDLAKKIKELIEEDYSEYEMSPGDAIRGQKKITWQKVSPDKRERNIYTSEKRLMRGIIGKLKRKIQLYGNPMKLSIFNQKKGKLNKRVLHRIPAGRNDVFKIMTVNEDKQLDVCLLVDESGSMSGDEITLARRSCIAVKEALQDNGKLNLWVFGHTADQKQGLATEMYEYSSPSMQDRPFACGAMKARYENRDGNAIYASAERVREQSDHPGAQKLMIIFSDGAPSADQYRGQTATKHTRQMVQKVEGMGFSVIQVGFGRWASHWQSKMFSNAIAVEDIDQMPKQIGKILMKVMKL